MGRWRKSKHKKIYLSFRDRSRLELEKAHYSRELQHPTIPDGTNDFSSIEYIRGKRVLAGGLVNPR